MAIYLAYSTFHFEDIIIITFLFQLKYTNNKFHGTQRCRLKNILFLNIVYSYT